MCADAKAQTEHVDGYKEDAAQGASPKFYLTHTAQEGGVGHAHKLLDERAEQNGIGNGPDAAVASGGGV